MEQVPVVETASDMMVVSAVAVAAVLIGMSKGGLRGLGSIGTILVALVLPAPVAVGLMLPLMIIADAVAVMVLRRHILLSVAAPIVAGSVVGVVAASSVLASLSPRTMEIAIAVMVLLFVSYRVASTAERLGSLSHSPMLATGQAGVVAGAVAGVTSTVAHVGGPPVTIHLLARRIAPLEFAGTSVTVFLVANWLKVPGYLYAGLIDWPLMRSLAPVAALVVPGVLAGRAVVARLDRQRFEWFILAGLLLGVGLLLA